MELQQKISEENLKQKIGEEQEVLVENKTFDNKYWIGRTKMDVPEMDGIVYIENNNEKNLINSFIKCKIIDIKGYDMIGKYIK